MTMTLIETKTLGTAAASIEFTSIPQTFTDLVFLISGRTTRTTSEDFILVAFNATTTGFSCRLLAGTGSGVVSASRTDGYIGGINTNGNTSNTFGNASFYIPNYTSSTSKSFSSDTVLENNATEAYQHIVAGLWTGTAAINAVKFSSGNTFDLVAGSTISLYGITKGSSGGVVVS